MAVWTHVRATSILTNNLSHVCSSGTKIYYFNNTTQDIYEYDPSTDTETLIIDASAIAGYGTTFSIAWFNGDLYVMDNYSAGAPKVERWDGTPNDLTTVKSFTVNGGPTQTGMMGIGSTLVAFTVSNPASPASYSAECFYTSDGTTWSTGSWDNDVWSPPDLNGAFDAPKNTAFPNGLYREFVTDTNHPTRTTTTEKSIFQFIEGVWTKIAVLNTSTAELYKFSSPNEGIHFRYAAGSYYPDDTFTSPATIAGGYYQMYQVNMPYSTAMSFSPNTIYQLSGLTWASLDALNVLWDIEPTASPVIVRMTNGDVYMVAYSSIGGGYDVRIFSRDTPIIVDTDSGKRLWIFKGNGISWSSRGIMTND